MFDLPKMTHATLPEEMGTASRSIAAMDVGDIGWTVPWAMFADDERRLWLNGRYALHAQPGGTAVMAVWRGEDGWHVDASRCDPDQRWGTGNHFVGGANGVAVATFTR